MRRFKIYSALAAQDPALRAIIMGQDDSAVTEQAGTIIGNDVVDYVWNGQGCVKMNS